MFNTIPEIEEAMADVILTSEYPAIVKEYERLLTIMGNVDGNEVIALVLCAVGGVDAARIMNKRGDT